MTSILARLWCVPHGTPPWQINNDGAYNGALFCGGWARVDWLTVAQCVATGLIGIAAGYVGGLLMYYLMGVPPDDDGGHGGEHGGWFGDPSHDYRLDA